MMNAKHAAKPIHRGISKKNARFIAIPKLSANPYTSKNPANLRSFMLMFMYSNCERSALTILRGKNAENLLYIFHHPSKLGLRDFIIPTNIICPNKITASKTQNRISVTLIRGKLDNIMRKVRPKEGIITPSIMYISEKSLSCDPYLLI